MSDKKVIDEEIGKELEDRLDDDDQGVLDDDDYTVKVHREDYTVKRRFFDKGKALEAADSLRLDKRNIVEDNIEHDFVTLIDEEDDVDWDKLVDAGLMFFPPISDAAQKKLEDTSNVAEELAAERALVGNELDKTMTMGSRGKINYPKIEPRKDFVEKAGTEVSIEIEIDDEDVDFEFDNELDILGDGPVDEADDDFEDALVEGVENESEDALEEGFENESEDALVEGVENDFEDALEEGIENESEDALEEGLKNEFEDALEEGLKNEFEDALEEGFENESEDALEEGLKNEFEDAPEEGLENEFEDEFENGYEEEYKPGPVKKKHARSGFSFGKIAGFVLVVIICGGGLFLYFDNGFFTGDTVSSVPVKNSVVTKIATKPQPVEAFDEENGDQQIVSDSGMPEQAAVDGVHEQAVDVEDVEQVVDIEDVEQAVDVEDVEQAADVAEIVVPEVTKHYPYTLHLSSYKSQAKADSEVSRISKKGYDAYSAYIDIPGKGGWYRIYSGYYDDFKKATQKAELIKKKLRENAIVTKTIFAVQVGEVDLMENLSELKSTLQAKGYSIYFVPVNDEEEYTRILAGAYRKENGAKGLNERLSADGFDVKIVKR